MDRRAARTRRSLHGALMSLILRKGYEGITVQDIIDEADIGRSTFYAHYTGKEDLLRSGFDMLRAEMAEVQRAARADAQGSQREPLAFSLAMFEHIAGYADIYRALVGGRGGLVAINEIRRILSDMVKTELSAARDNRGIARELRLQFVVDTFLTVLIWWLERKPTLAPHEVDAMFRSLALDGIGPSIGARSRRDRGRARHE
jgi:AcrR family transcriptional regulator